MAGQPRDFRILALYRFVTSIRPPNGHAAGPPRHGPFDRCDPHHRLPDPARGVSDVPPVMVAATAMPVPVLSVAVEPTPEPAAIATSISPSPTPKAEPARMQTVTPTSLAAATPTPSPTSTPRPADNPALGTGHLIRHRPALLPLRALSQTGRPRAALWYGCSLILPHWILISRTT